MADLAGLIEKVKAATGEDREIDWLVAERFGIPEPWLETTMWPGFAPGSRLDKSIPPFSGSLDAVVALADEVLGGVMWRVQSDPDTGDGFQATVITPTSDATCEGATPALALLLAILTAKQEASNG